MRRTVGIVAVVSLALALWSCRDMLVDPGLGDPAGTARTLRIAPQRLDLALGSSASVTATLVDAKGLVVPLPGGVAFTFTSSVPRVFGAGADGVVTALGNGEGELRAAVGALFVGIPVRVVPVQPRLVKVEGDAQSGVVGTELALPLVIRSQLTNGRPERGVPVDFAVTVGSVRPARVVTDSNGLASVRWTVGPTRGAQSLVASAGGTATVTFVATALRRTAAHVVVTPETVALTDAGKTAQLGATARDAAGDAIPDVVFTWASSDTNVAIVDQTGLVTAKKAGATAISATVDGISNSSAVTVTIPLPVIAASPSAPLFLTSTLGADDGVFSRTVVITNAGGGALSGLAASIAYATASPIAWIDKLSLESTVAPTALRFIVQRGALRIGTYDATVTLTSTVTGVKPLDIPVRLVVSPGGARLGLSADSVEGISFTNGPSVRVAVAVVDRAGVGTAALGPINCTTNAPVEFFSLISCRDSVVVSLSPGGNLTGSQVATVRVSSAFTADTVPLRLTRTAARPALRVVPESLTVRPPTNSAAVRVAAAVLVGVLPGAPAYPRASLGALQCALKAPVGAPAASVALCGDSIAIAITPGADAGTFRYSVDVSAPGALIAVDRVSFPVTVITTSGTLPTIASSPAGLLSITTSFGVDDGIFNRTVAVMNAGGGTLSGLAARLAYRAGQPQGWIESLALDGSTSPTTLRFTVRRGALRIGTYDATVTLTSTVAGVTPLDIPIRLVVVSNGAKLGLSRDSINARNYAGGPAVRAAVAVIESTGLGRAALGTISCSPIKYGEVTGWANLVSCGDSVVVLLNDRGRTGGDAIIRVTGSFVTDTVTLRIRFLAFPPTLRMVPTTLAMSAVTNGTLVRAAAAVAVDVVSGAPAFPLASLGALTCVLTAPAGAPSAAVVSCADSVALSISPGATAGSFQYRVTVEAPNATVRVTSTILPIDATIATASVPLAAGAIFGGCAVADKVYCWGNNSSGEVGDGTTQMQTLATPVSATSEQLVRVAAGSAYKCGLSAVLVPLCWGSNASGATGQGSLAGSALTPRRVTTLPAATYQRLGVGTGTACAAGDNSVNVLIYCWGNNQSGQLGTGSLELVTSAPGTPVALAEQLVYSVAVGATHACAIAGGAPYRLYCWGEGWLLGNGTTDQRTQAVPVLVQFPDDLPSSGLAAGSETTCLISYSNYMLYCWGSNRNGETGTGVTGVVSVPTRVTFPGFPGSVPMHDVVAGANHTCAIVAGGTYCWGKNDVGQLGSGDVAGSSNVPRRIVGDPGFATLSVSGSTTCGLVTADGSVWCWGYGQTGELGNGTFGSNSSVPVRVRRR